MEEKSDIEILKEFAKSTGRSIEAIEQPYPRTGIRTTQKFKRMVYMPGNHERTSFFVWYSDPYSTVGQTTIYSGAFIPVTSNIKSSISIRNRYFLDKLNLLSKTKENKIGNDHFDSRVVISGNLDAATKRLLSSSKTQKQILMALEIESYFQASINEYKIDFVPELIDSPYFSIISRQEWVIEKNKIESMFDHIEKIRELMIQPVHQ